MMSDASAGFSEETFSFLRDLDANNDKSWFEENRKRYEESWLAAAADFIAAVAPAMAALSPPHEAVPKVNKSIRRINRDVRFSADKSPYKASLHLVFWTGDHPNRSPAIHLVLRPDEVGYGAGQWALTPAQLDAYRTAVLDEDRRDALKKSIADAKATGCDLPEPELKKPPRGMPTDSATDDLLRRKSVVVRTIDKPLSPADFTGQAGIERFIALSSKLAPINHWLRSLDDVS